jgi:hypothetical protein
MIDGYVPDKSAANFSHLSDLLMANCSRSMAIRSDLNYTELGNAGPAKLWDGDVAVSNLT